MLRFLVTTVLFASVLGGILPDDGFNFFMDFQHDNRIVGGEEANITDAPWQVALLRASGSSVYQSCGGSIIKSNVILTAAHCLAGTSVGIWSVRAGSELSLSGGQLVGVQTMVVHNLYGQTFNRFDHDIAVMVTSESIELDQISTGTIGLPEQGQSVADGSLGLITGWGGIRDGGPTVPNLRKANIQVVNQEQCVETYGSGLVTTRMICLADLVNGGVDACQGDSGGPFVLGDVIFGVTSWGYACASPRYPGVWTRVPLFRNWIDANTPEL